MTGAGVAEVVIDSMLHHMTRPERQVDEIEFGGPRPGRRGLLPVLFVLALIAAGALAVWQRHTPDRHTAATTGSSTPTVVTVPEASAVVTLGGGVATSTSGSRFGVAIPIRNLGRETAHVATMRITMPAGYTDVRMGLLPSTRNGDVDLAKAAAWPQTMDVASGQAIELVFQGRTQCPTGTPGIEPTVELAINDEPLVLPLVTTPAWEEMVDEGSCRS
jgi:hypothetical protein